MVDDHLKGNHRDERNAPYILRRIRIGSIVLMLGRMLQWVSYSRRKDVGGHPTGSVPETRQSDASNRREREPYMSPSFRQRKPLKAQLPRKAVRIEEAAASLGVSPDWFKEHVFPEIETVRRGRMLLIPEGELDSWVRAEKSPVEF